MRLLTLPQFVVRAGFPSPGGPSVLSLILGGPEVAEEADQVPR